MNEQFKAAVSVSDMARMVSLSRARFYQLINEGVFPHPVYTVSNRRPIYVEELQKVCLEVRRRNCGVNGKPILFYAKGNPVGRPSKTKSKPKKKDQYPEIRAAVQALGLTTVTSGDVANAVKTVYPNGMDGVSQAEVIRGVFLHVKRQE